MFAQTIWTSGLADKLDTVGEYGLYRILVNSALSVSSERPEAPSETRWVTAEEILDVGVQLASAPSANWWSASWHERPQVWLSTGPGPPTQTYLAPPAPGKPRVELWTSSFLENRVSSWWPVAESGALGPVREKPWKTWRLSIPESVRVVEIQKAEDWGLLCSRFPRPAANGLLAPDWEKVAEQYHGVHVTPLGILLAQGVPVRCEEGEAMLWSWDAESTAWLRPFAESSSLL